MKKQWLISILLTVVIFGSGAYAFYFIQDYMPDQLDVPSTILASEEVNAEQTATKTSKPLKEVIYDTQKRVVKIELPDGSLGSGFLYNNKGDIITNAHVVAGASEVNVKTTDAREFSGTVIGISETIDVAVVRVDELKEIEPLTISEAEGEIGDEVLALGNPLGFENTVTTGIISGLNRDLDLPPYQYEGLYQISAPIAPGNSGGPLVNRKTGEVLGINSARTEEGSIGFSIPIADVLDLVQGWSDEPMASLPDPMQGVEESAQPNNEPYSDEDLAVYLVQYFYENLAYEDYVTAYSLLGSNWQAETSYETFRGGYLNTMSVTLKDATVTNSEGHIQVTTVVSAEEWVDGETHISKYQGTYTVGKENGEMVLLSGELEKISETVKEDTSEEEASEQAANGQNVSEQNTSEPEVNEQNTSEQKAS